MALLLYLAALIISVQATDLESRAKLLASKSVLNQFIVENKDLTVVYKIYNIGSSPAYNVWLTDESFPVTEFDVVQGQISTQWKSIAPGKLRRVASTFRLSGGNVTHVVILQPIKSGYFNFTAAQLTYEPTEGGDQQMAFTSAPGEGGIMSEIEFNRKHSPHLMEWGVFALLCTPSLLIPFLLWYRSHSKYSESKSKKA